MIITDGLESSRAEAFATCTSDECQTDTSGQPDVDGDDSESDEK